MEKRFALQSFGESLNIPDFTFRDKVRSFLEVYAELEDNEFPRIKIWRTFLEDENRGLVVPLYTMEEEVGSSKPYCDHCRGIGVGTHFVSKRRYHFVIPKDGALKQPLDESVFNEKSHLLHGLIHSNGVGHLLRINGVQGGSRHIFGREIMDLWDRLCKSLNARKITVADSAEKHSMALRLLHGIAYQHTWFGRWNYLFCHGRFGMDKGNYTDAISSLGRLELSSFMRGLAGSKASNVDVNRILGLYTDLSEGQLKTLNDLLKFMLTLRVRAQLEKPTLGSSENLPSSSSSSTPHRSATTSTTVKLDALDSQSEGVKSFNDIIHTIDRRYTQKPRQLEDAANEMVRTLIALASSHKDGKVTRTALLKECEKLKGEYRMYDRISSKLEDVRVGDHVVHKIKTERGNAYFVTKAGSGAVNSSEPSGSEILPVSITPHSTSPNKIDVYRDVMVLYNQILKNEYSKSYAEELSKAHLFVKEWKMHEKRGELLKLLVKFSEDGVEESFHIQSESTTEDLAMAVRDVYCFDPDSINKEIRIEGVEHVWEGEAMIGKVGSGTKITIYGLSPILQTVRITSCHCGANEDDGEEMVQCKTCTLWQHTKCSELLETDEVTPADCHYCYTQILEKQRASVFESSY